MTKIQKRLLAVIGVLMVVSMIINVTLVKAFYYNPNQIKVNYHTIKSTQIPESMDGTTIVFISDLQYGDYQNDERCDTLFNKIYELNPSILLFGGDMYDSGYKFSDETNKKLIKYFKKVEAPLGKFAVYGDSDLVNEDVHAAVWDILLRSEIEILRNKGFMIRNGSNEGINLIAFDLEPDIMISNNVATDQTFDLLFTHYPDNLVAEGLIGTSIDFAFAGHSHDSQILLPIFGNYRETEHSMLLNRNKQEKLDFEYILSNGIGCTKINARLNSTPSIEYIILEHKNTNIISEKMEDMTSENKEAQK